MCWGLPPGDDREDRWDGTEDTAPSPVRGSSWPGEGARPGYPQDKLGWSQGRSQRDSGGEGGPTPRKFWGNHCLSSQPEERTGPSSISFLTPLPPSLSYGIVFRAGGPGLKTCYEKGIFKLSTELEAPNTLYLHLSLPDPNPEAIYSRCTLKWFCPPMYSFEQHSGSNCRITALPEDLGKPQGTGHLAHP